MSRPVWLFTMLLAVATAGVGADRPDLQQARAAVERRDFAAALPLYTQRLEAAPDDADLLIEVARVNGFADRNREAAALYRRALRAAPGRRADIVPSLAWQTLWSGMARPALALFDEASVIGDRADALDGSAQARLALDDAAGATRDWRAALALRPGDAGLQRRLEDGWLRRQTQSTAYASIEHSVDSDSLETLAVVVGGGLHLSGAATLDLRLRRLAQTDDQGDSQGEEMQATYAWRWDDPAGPLGGLRPSVALRVARFGDWTPVMGVLHAAWLPNDSWRVDAEWARDRIETPRATAEHVRVDVLSLSADQRFGPQLDATAALALLRFDDGNRRQRLHGHVDQLLAAQPRWSVGAAAMAFESSNPTGPGIPGRGYWNPKRYREGRLYTALRWNARPWDFSGQIGLGTALETDGFGNRSRGRPHQWELTLGRDLGPDLRASLMLAGSGNAFGLGGFGNGGSGGSGYSRRSVLFSVTGWFR
jgi:tetratricopeptide (TPR) repeat protein